MDPSHVALMDIALPNSIFEKYAISNEKKIGLKVRELLDAVKSLDKKSSVKVEFLTDSIRLTQKGMILSVKTEEPSSNDTPLPRIPYDARIELGQKQFKEIVKKAASVGDYLTIDTMDSTVIFSSKGDNGDYQETKTKEDFIELNNRNDSIATYSLEFIKELTKTLTKDSVLVLEYSTQKPLRIETKVNNMARIHFYLAPRVEN